MSDTLVEQSGWLPTAIRPQSLDEIIGLTSQVATIRNQLKSGRVPPSWLFVGPSGTGKTTLARILASELNAELVEVNASEVNGVADMEEVLKQTRYYPLPPYEKKLLILDEAQRITTAAQNLLLKPVEEPPPSVHWALCTTEEGKILPTIRRRCLRIETQPLNRADIAKLLRRAAQHVQADVDCEKLAADFAELSIDTPGLVLNNFELYLNGSAPKGLLDEDSLPVRQYCQALLSKNWDSVRSSLVDLTAADARSIRLAACSWLRKALLNSTNRQAALGLHYLTQAPPPEDPAFLGWLAVQSYQICNK